MYIILISALISYSNIDMINDEPIHLTTGVGRLAEALHGLLHHLTTHQHLLFHGL